MKGTKLFVLISGLTAYMVSMTAFAAMPLPFGWYVEGNLGESHTNGKYYPGPSRIDRNGFGGSIDGGYKFNPFFAAEIGYTGYAKTVIKNTAGAEAAKDQHYSFDATTKIMLPIGNSGVELFGKLGANRSNSYVTVYPAASLNNLVFNPGTHCSTHLYYGAGGDYAILPHLLVNAQWALAQGNNNTGNNGLYSLGLSWIF